MMYEVTKPLDIMSQNTNLAGRPIIYQLLSLPGKIVDRCVDTHQSDRYHKTMNYMEGACLFSLWCGHNKRRTEAIPINFKKRIKHHPICF